MPMTGRFPLRALASSAALALLCPVGASAAPAAPAAARPDASHDMAAVFSYLRGQKTTGFLVIQDGKVLAEQNWPAPEDPMFGAFTYGRAPDGALLEDVASQQKSFVSVLIGVAIDKGLVDVTRPVTDYLGAGWSKAPPDKERAIRVIDVLTMSSGLDEQFHYQYPAGTRFHYNTQVYATTKKILVTVAKMPLEAITRDWLTGPAGMTRTAWRQRPAGFVDVGNPTGLVTTPRDIATFGEMILHGGVAADGRRIISPASLQAMFARSATNPAYGRLWWLNGSSYTMRPFGARAEGPLIPAAPADLVAALGALDRRLYVVPSLRLVVVRTGAQPDDAGFDQQLWLRLIKVLQPGHD
jgi:CubicO group peptidase (beta-lactamase class C family)